MSQGATGRIEVPYATDQSMLKACNRTPRGERCKDNPVKRDSRCGGIRVAPGTEGAGQSDRKSHKRTDPWTGSFVYHRLALRACRHELDEQDERERDQAEQRDREESEVVHPTNQTVVTAERVAVRDAFENDVIEGD